MNNSVLEQYRKRHESTLRELILSANIPATRIKEAILYALFPGGKRLRPMLVYLCGELVDVELAYLDRIAASIELIHCYSLVHDDLPAMDNDDFRRGKPSCHRAFDEATAILVGDGMQALAIETLINPHSYTLDAQQMIAVTKELIQACGVSGMVSGQSLDLSELSNPNLTEHTLTHIHELKTSRLIKACINMVLAAGTPSAHVQTALQQFSESLGLVFQMQDDYLDHYGKENTLGKGRCSDTANHKITFANLYSKHMLKEKINHLFQETIHTLEPFGERAYPLTVLIQSIHHPEVSSAPSNHFAN